MKISLPENYPTGECILLPIDTGLAPLVTAALVEYTERHTWEAESYENGYRAFQELLSAMTNNCIADLVQEIRDFRGLQPAYSSVPVEERTSDMYNSINELLAANLAMRGVLSDGWFEDQFATITDLVQAQRGTDKTNTVGLWDDVANLLSSAGSVASIVEVIAGVLEQQEETVVEGGLLTALIAITAANTGVMQQIALTQTFQMNTLNAILNAITGGTTPTDSVLEALRGNTPADAARNITELLA